MNSFFLITLITFAITWAVHGANTPEHRSIRTHAALACKVKIKPNFLLLQLIECQKHATESELWNKKLHCLLLSSSLSWYQDIIFYYIYVCVQRPTNLGMMTKSYSWQKDLAETIQCVRYFLLLNRPYDTQLKLEKGMELSNYRTVRQYDFLGFVCLPIFQTPYKAKRYIIHHGFVHFARTCPN